MSTLLPEIKALGTVWWIEIFSEISTAKKQVVYDDLLLFIANFENKYSRFKPDSLITKLNTNGSLENPDQMTIDMFHKGQELFIKTNGLFNFLIGEILENRGYDANYSFTIKETVNKKINALENLVISPNLITLKSGRVDLGGFGKGYLIDLLTERLKNTHQLNYFLTNGGGDMYATSDKGTPITIYLEHPTNPETYIGTTTLLDQGFAASSPHKRQWIVNSKKYNHIVSAENEIKIDGTFIKAKTAYEADAFATTVLMLDPVEIPSFARKNNFAVTFVPANETSLISTKNWL